MSRSLIAAALALTTLTAPAFAATSTFRMEVDVVKANLAAPAGAEKEYDSLKQQVAERCDAEFEDLKYGRSFTIGACNERTLSNTVRAIGNANLTEVHANRD